MKDSPSRILNIWASSWFQRWIIPALIFIFAFLPRAIEPISRPHVWFRRSFVFVNAISEQDWISTFQRYHPGVSLMWLSGLGMDIYQRIEGALRLEQVFNLEPVRPGLINDLTTAAIIPLAAAIAFCIALTYPILKRLSGTSIALVGALLLAFDPFHIAYSKVVHLDALLASFMIVSALFFILYLKEKRLHNLILSGLFAGFSFLTKSPSVFLIPYTGLVLAISYFGGLFTQTDSNKLTLLRKQLWPAARVFLIWAVVAAVTFIVLFPAMWVRPNQVLSDIVESIISHTASPHKNPVYFAGRLWEDDPGIQFHLAILIWKTTALTLPLIAVAVIWGFVRQWDWGKKTLWALIIYAFFFTLQMGIADKKQMAYILPTFPAVSIIAAFGLVWTVEAVAKWLHWETGGWKTAAILSLAIVIQFALAIRLHPHYGAQHNLLVGGSRTAANILPIQDQGEGLDLAAKYLNQLPYGQDKRAAVFRRNAYVFEKYYDGLSSRELDPSFSYRVYDLNSVLRDFQGDISWLESWQKDQQSEPLYTVELDGVEYVWVYGDLPEDPVKGGPVMETDFTLGDSIQLKTVRLNDTVFSPGDPLVVVLEWQTEELIDDDLTVFTHLLSAEGELVAQQDNIPLLGARPTTTWRPGELMRDVHLIWLPDDLQPGEYELSTGMYNSETIVRLPVHDENGDRIVEDIATLGSVRIVPSE